ncbi:MAG: roadblock/LC7 domain-containing protein [Desulfobacula sp.]|jgi:hypothetical protein
MPNVEQFGSILKVTGIDQYILVDKTAKIITHNMTDPEKMAEITSVCGFKSQEIGKSNFSYIMFSRKNHNNFFIFPVGKYYLGVIKQKTVSNDLLVENILQFLKDSVNHK